MNPNSDNLSSEDARLDRLVDGELSEAERRRLLATLDSEPGGWRRCALAFLESQCWKESLGAVARMESPAEQRAAAPRPVRRSAWRRHAATAMAMAASFLIALGLVSWMHRAPSGQPVGADVAIVGRPAGSPETLNRAGPSVRGLGNPASGPWRLVTLSTPASDSTPQRSISLPAMERDNIDDAWLSNLPPAIPDDVLRALARTGHEVQQRRELVPVPLQDGRRLVVPVDQVEVHYTGNSAY